MPCGAAPSSKPHGQPKGCRQRSGRQRMREQRTKRLGACTGHAPTAHARAAAAGAHPLSLPNPFRHCAHQPPPPVLLLPLVVMTATGRSTGQVVRPITITTPPHHHHHRIVVSSTVTTIAAAHAPRPQSPAAHARRAGGQGARQRCSRRVPMPCAMADTAGWQCVCWRPPHMQPRAPSCRCLAACACATRRQRTRHARMHTHAAGGRATHHGWGVVPTQHGPLVQEPANTRTGTCAHTHGGQSRREG